MDECLAAINERVAAAADALSGPRCHASRRGYRPRLR